MRARSLKHKIIFQKHTKERNNFGELIDKWQDVFSCRASIQTISGKEAYLSNQNYSSMTHKLRVRYSNKINSKQRILFGTRIFEMIGPPLNIFEANKEFEILCKEVVND